MIRHFRVWVGFYFLLFLSGALMEFSLRCATGERRSWRPPAGIGVPFWGHLWTQTSDSRYTALSRWVLVGALIGAFLAIWFYVVTTHGDGRPFR